MPLSASYPPESAPAASLGIAVLHPFYFVLRLPGEGIVVFCTHGCVLCVKLLSGTEINGAVV
jgi:hypothetical protein